MCTVRICMQYFVECISYLSLFLRENCCPISLCKLSMSSRKYINSSGNRLRNICKIEVVATLDCRHKANLKLSYTMILPLWKYLVKPICSISDLQFRLRSHTTNIGYAMFFQNGCIAIEFYPSRTQRGLLGFLY